MKSHKQTARNVFTGWADLLVHLLLLFFLTPFIIHKLGDSLYGLWVLLGSLTGYFGLLNLGIDQAITKYVAEFKAKKEYFKINNLISTSFLIFCSLGLVVIVAGIAIYFYLNKIFNIEALYLNETKIAFLIVTANMAISFPFYVFRGIIMGLQRYDFLYSTSMISDVVRAGLIVYFLNKGYGLAALAFIAFCISLLSNLAIFIYYKCRYREMKTRFLVFDRKSAKLIFGYSIYAFIGIIANRFAVYTDSIVIGIFLTSAMITHYAIAWRLIEYAKAFSTKMTMVLMPKASEIAAKGDFHKLQELFLKGCKASLMISLPILLVYIFLGDIFFKLWIGQDYMASHIYLIVLLIPQIFLINQHTGVAIIYGIAKHKFYVLAGMVSAIANIVLSILLLKIWGLLGVALGTAIPLSILGIAVMPYYYKKTIGLSVKRYVNTLSMFLIPGAALSFLLWQLRMRYTFTTLISFFLLSALCAAVFCISAFYISFSRSDRKRIIDLFPKLKA